MLDHMTLDDVTDVLALRRERRARRAQMLAWLKFAMVACVFAAIMILR